MPMMHCFLVDNIAEEVANYYVDVFPDGEMTDMFKSPGPNGEEIVVLANIRINDTPMMILNGPSGKVPNESSSFVVSCKDQAEVDHFWNRFVGDGGMEGNCSWCQDKYGFWWQVVPEEMPSLFSDPDPVRAGKAFQAMMTMNKIDLAAIKAAMDS